MISLVVMCVLIMVAILLMTFAHFERKYTLDVFLILIRLLLFQLVLPW